MESVCFIVPVLNEERHVERCVHDLYAQTDCEITEVIIADGGSTDQTVAIVQRLRHTYSTLRVIANPRRSQAAAVNIAVAAAELRADIFVRFDAHSRYAPDFAYQCVTALRVNRATSTVVSMRTVGMSGFQRAVAAASNSRLGNGGAPHRHGGQVSRFVDHGHHAAFDRAFFVRAGGYDEDMPPNEDFEYDTRSWRLGGKVWLAAEAPLDYFPRPTPWKLAKQYFGYGQGRAKSHLKHRAPPGIRQLLPPFLFLLTFCSCVSAPIHWVFAVPALLYILACLIYGAAVLALWQRDAWLLASGFAAIIMHLSYGAGVFGTLIDRARRHLVRRIEQAHVA
jgi:succinoglycan biosynthesis protein ExoA